MVSSVRMRRCNCEELQFLDVRISSSRANPNRLYYKCSSCGSFEWLGEADVTGGNHQIGIERNIMNNEGLSEVKQLLSNLIENGKFIVKMVVVMYLGLIVCVMLK